MDRHGGPFPIFGRGYPGRMRRLVLFLFVLGSACSVQDGPGAEAAPAAPSTTTPTTTVVAESSTTTVAVEPSTATILIGPARYDLTAVCAAGGAGEIEVGLTGHDVNGIRVVGYVRAFLGEPYVSLQVGEGADAVLFEPRLEGVLTFEPTSDGVEFPEVDFVTDLDLETGAFVPAGIGSVEVDCPVYVRELPPVVFD
jgi:hypothetical protein